MKPEVCHIQQLLKNSWNGRMWHGTNLQEALKDVDAQKAFRKPFVGAHNIYELVMHLHCWRKFVLEHLNGNADYKVEINSAIDWPVNYGSTDANWQQALILLQKSQVELVEALANLKDADLDEPMHGRKFSWYDLMHRLIHHDIYHSGQIAILKK